MENKRILEVYKKREMRAKNKEAFFGFENPAHLFRVHERYRATLFLLKSQRYHPLSDFRILDVGCGNGNMLRQFLQWGARPENLGGIELRREPVDYALSLNPNLDIRCGSATELPWPDSSFDLVCQHTVFSSILDWEMKKRIASEMVRVLTSNGLILWYDFWLNPTNPQTRGIRPAETCPDGSSLAHRVEGSSGCFPIAAMNFILPVRVPVCESTRSGRRTQTGASLSHLPSHANWQPSHGDCACFWKA